MLDRPVIRNNIGFDFLIPYTESNQVFYQIPVHLDELARNRSAAINIARNRLDTFIEPENLRGRRSRHRR